MWKVRIVSCVPGSPIDWAAITPTASPDVDQHAAAQIAPVALGANAVARVAGQRRAHLDLVDPQLFDAVDRVLVEQAAGSEQHVLRVGIHHVDRHRTRPRIRSRSASITSPPSTSARMATPLAVPQSSSVTTRSCVTSTRRRVR